MMNTQSTLIKALGKAFQSEEFKSFNNMWKETFTGKDTLESLYAAVNNNSIITETLSKTEEQAVTKLLKMFTQEQVTMLGIKVHKLSISIEG